MFRLHTAAITARSRCTLRTTSQIRGCWSQLIGQLASDAGTSILSARGVAPATLAIVAPLKLPPPLLLLLLPAAAAVRLAAVSASVARLHFVCSTSALVCAHWTGWLMKGSISVRSSDQS